MIRHRCRVASDESRGQTTTKLCLATSNTRNSEPPVMLEYQLTQHGLRVEPGVENMSLIRLSQAAVRFQHKCSSTSPTIPRRLNSQKSVRSTLSTTMCPSQFCSNQERPLAGARGCRVNRDPLLQTRKGVLTCRRERSVHADSEREAALLTSSLFPFMNA